MAEKTETVLHDALVIDDNRWQELIEITDGAAAQCFQCGVCTATCPWGLVKDETVSIRTLMRQAQLGMPDGKEQLWLCTTCAQCEAYCPRGVVITDVFRGLRHATWNQNTAEEGLPTVLWSVYWNNNPWSQAPSQRSHWSRDLDLPYYDAGQHEVLYYIGCTSAYNQRGHSVAHALANIYTHAGVSFGILGDDEPCCGESVLNVGHKDYFEELVDKNSAFFEDTGVGTMVTISPHCYDAFKNYYPNPTGKFEPLPYTQHLARLMDEGRLKFKKKLKLKVTLQDPCYLARHNQDIDSPRQVLNAIPGIELVEMEHNGVDTLCCGGGGGRMWLETEAHERFSNLRVDEATQTGASVLATACPACISCLEDSVKAKKIDGIVVMDIAEIVALALDVN